jgi:hypothetical protein
MGSCAKRLPCNFHLCLLSHQLRRHHNAIFLVSQPSVKTRMIMSILILDLKALLSTTMHIFINTVITQQVNIMADRTTTSTPWPCGI